MTEKENAPLCQSKHILAILFLVDLPHIFPQNSQNMPRKIKTKQNNKKTSHSSDKQFLGFFFCD